jgi:hypothetical protein
MGLERSHNRGKEDAKSIGIRRRVSQEEINRELIELRVQISHIR